MLNLNLDFTSALHLWFYGSQTAVSSVCAGHYCAERQLRASQQVPKGSRLSTKGGWGCPTRLTGLDSLTWDHHWPLQWTWLATYISAKQPIGCYHCINGAKYLAPLFFCSVLFRAGCKYALCWNQSAIFLTAWSYNSQWVADACGSRPWTSGISSVFPWHRNLHSLWSSS